jgi:hypothetical protein
MIKLEVVRQCQQMATYPPETMYVRSSIFITFLSMQRDGCQWSIEGGYVLKISRIISFSSSPFGRTDRETFRDLQERLDLDHLLAVQVHLLTTNSSRIRGHSAWGSCPTISTLPFPRPSSNYCTTVVGAYDITVTLHKLRACASDV